MDIVLLTALGVGGATVFGAIVGFIFKNISEKYKDVTLGAAAGVMLSASVFNLILPSLELGGKFAAPIAALGVISGGAVIDLLDRAVRRIGKRISAVRARTSVTESRHKVLLLVLAIAIHNLP